MATVPIRPADPGDIPALIAIYIANGEVLPDDLAVPEAYLVHLVASATVLLATDEAGVTGFASVVDAGPVAQLTDLFVHPRTQGSGIGQQLLAAAFGNRFPRTTFASNDPRALPLYVRAGMRPLWPDIHLAGDGRLLAAVPDLAVRPASADDITAFERRVSGIDRARDHDFWSRLPEAEPFVVHSADRIVAAGHAHRDRGGHGRWLDRLLLSNDAEIRPVVLAALRFAGRDGPLSLAIPGPNPALGDLLAAGFRISDRDTFLASEAGLFDPERFLPHAGLL